MSTNLTDEQIAELLAKYEPPEGLSDQTLKFIGIVRQLQAERDLMSKLYAKEGLKAMVLAEQLTELKQAIEALEVRG